MKNFAGEMLNRSSNWHANSTILCESTWKDPITPKQLSAFLRRTAANIKTFELSFRPICFGLKKIFGSCFKWEPESGFVKERIRTLLQSPSKKKKEPMRTLST